MDRPALSSHRKSGNFSQVSVYSPGVRPAWSSPSRKSLLRPVTIDTNRTERSAKGISMLRNSVGRSGWARTAFSPMLVLPTPDLATTSMSCPGAIPWGALSRNILRPRSRRCTPEVTCSTCSSKPAFRPLSNVQLEEGLRSALTGRPLDIAHVLNQARILQKVEGGEDTPVLRAPLVAMAVHRLGDVRCGALAGVPATRLGHRPHDLDCFLL